MWENSAFGIQRSAFTSQVSVLAALCTTSIGRYISDISCYDQSSRRPFVLSETKDTRTIPMTIAIVNENVIHIIESVRFALLDNRAKNR
jgi:hypothetical protein